MEQMGVTAATIIHTAQELEDKSAEFYEELAGQLGPHKDMLLGFARESRKHKTLVVRTYQETITDALEACFSFEGLNLRDYDLGSLSVTLVTARRLEETAIRFYSELAVSCASLLGTIPRAFRRVADARKKRLAELQGMQ
jgi:rubrerythrin